MDNIVAMLYKKVLLEDGFTFNISGQYIIDEGYVVSLRYYTRKIPIEEFLPHHLSDYIIDMGELLFDDDIDRCLGAWINEDMVYLDVNREYTSEKEAREKAVWEEQKSYYDLENKKAVFI